MHGRRPPNGGVPPAKGDPFSTPARRRRIIADVAKKVLKHYCLTACDNVHRLRIETAASIIIQCAWRCCRARRRLRRLKRRKQRKNAIIIQSYTRRFLAILLRRKLTKDRFQQNGRRLKSLLVPRWRSYVERMNTRRDLYHKCLKRRKKRHEAAITIQKHSRRCVFHQVVQILLYAKKIKNYKFNRDATKIQSMARMFVKRQQYQRWKKHKASIEMVRRNVHKWWELCKTRKRIRLKKLNAAAVKIQTQVRRMLAMKLLQKLREEAAAKALIVPIREPTPEPIIYPLKPSPRRERIEIRVEMNVSIIQSLKAGGWRNFIMWCLENAILYYNIDTGYRPGAIILQVMKSVEMVQFQKEREKERLKMELQGEAPTSVQGDEQVGGPNWEMHGKDSVITIKSWEESQSPWQQPEEDAMPVDINQPFQGHGGQKVSNENIRDDNPNSGSSEVTKGYRMCIRDGSEAVIQKLPLESEGESSIIIAESGQEHMQEDRASGNQIELIMTGEKIAFMKEGFYRIMVSPREDCRNEDSVVEENPLVDYCVTLFGNRDDFVSIKTASPTESSTPAVTDAKVYFRNAVVQFHKEDEVEESTQVVDEESDMEEEATPEEPVVIASRKPSVFRIVLEEPEPPPEPEPEPLPPPIDYDEMARRIQILYRPRYHLRDFASRIISQAYRRSKLLFRWQQIVHTYHRLIKRSVLIIQCAIRCFLSRCRYRILKQEYDDENFPFGHDFHASTELENWEAFGFSFGDTPMEVEATLRSVILVKQDIIPEQISILSSDTSKQDGDSTAIETTTSPTPTKKSKKSKNKEVLHTVHATNPLSGLVRMMEIPEQPPSCVPLDPIGKSGSNLQPCIRIVSRIRPDESFVTLADSNISTVDSNEKSSPTDGQAAVDTENFQTQSEGIIQKSLYGFWSQREQDRERARVEAEIRQQRQLEEEKKRLEMNNVVQDDNATTKKLNNKLSDKRSEDEDDDDEDGDDDEEDDDGDEDGDEGDDTENPAEATDKESSSEKIAPKMEDKIELSDDSIKSIPYFLFNRHFSKTFPQWSEFIEPAIVFVNGSSNNDNGKQTSMEEPWYDGIQEIHPDLTNNRSGEIPFCVSLAKKFI